MNVELPHWLLFLAAVALIIWIMAGVIVAKTADVIRKQYGGGGRYLRFGLPPQPPQPPQNPYDDADWWKKE